ncbi:ABC transporter G family member 40, partial [Linum perenne]
LTYPSVYKQHFISLPLSIFTFHLSFLPSFTCLIRTHLHLFLLCFYIKQCSDSGASNAPMEGGDLYRAGNSIRRSGSASIWRNNPSDVFSASSREENDEEALKWAALERLPTYDRLRKGILASASKTELSEIDVQNLGVEDRKLLLDRLVRVTDQDNEKFLLKLKNRLDRVGVELPTIEVRYQNLNVEAEATVGSKALPSFLNFSVVIFESEIFSILIIKPLNLNLCFFPFSLNCVHVSRLTLLLGPPSSGKTSLLLALSGRLDPTLKVSGRVTYNGHEMNEFIPQKTAAYISQHDLHMGELTVRETFSFAGRVQGVGSFQDMLAELSRREKAANIKPDPDLDVFMKAVATEGLETSVVTDYVLKILGLEGCADTLVGDEMIRGISGGQRKRVTTGEMLVGPARALFMDEISTGLDSSTTFQIVNTLKQFNHILNTTIVVSLLQPAPETYDLFDDIILLSDGQVVYEGPRDNVLEFFEHMGFRCPDRKGVADFLQEVTSKKDQKQYWATRDQPYRYVTVKEFAEAFQSFHVGRKIADDLSAEMHRDSIVSGGMYVGALFFTLVMIMFNYVLLVALSQMASALFRAIAACGRHMIVANTFGSFVLILLFALSGFVLSRENVKKWWVWAYWSSPMMYGQNAIVINEFLGNSWSKVPANSTESLGIQVLRSRGFFTEPHWYWLGFGATIGFLFLFNIVFAVALTFLDSSISEDDDEASRSKKKGMVLPFEPHSITFDDVIYSVDMPQEMKAQGVDEDKLVLLKGVSGAFRPGVLTALMGVSGAGKTTLMDVLAGRKTGGYIEGDITISGYPKKQETFARISGYCEQNDIHSPQVTVYESLVYSAWLRLPKEVEENTRMMFVEQVMELVELNPLRNSLVGLPGVSGLTTEQRKRLTIAVELVANPSIIFMDEPTSGLDARAAAIVMRTVRNTVDTGRTVVCTIHQPSIDIFEAFDELLLLKRGGQEIYVGPLGRHSTHLVKYFEEIDGVSKIKDGYNPATWMLEVTTTAQEIAMGVDFTEIYKKSDLYRRNKALIKDLSKAAPGSKELYFATKYSQSFLTQCQACLWKQHWSYWRNPPYTAVRFWFTTFIGLMFGTIFWDLGGRVSRQQDLFNALGSLFASVMFIGVQNASAVQPVVAIERTVFYRERAAGMYSALPYAYAQVLIELPYVFIQTVMFGLVTYAMIGFEYYGMMTVAVTPNYHIAAIISSFFYSFWNLFCGFMIPRPSIPVWWRWYYWADPISWTLYGLLGSQYGNVKTTMETGQSVEDFLRTYYGFEHEFLGVVAGVIVGLTVSFAVIFAVAIKSFNFQRR